MAIEIERRFLVRDAHAVNFGLGTAGRYRIRQGYLGWIDALRVRVRVITDCSDQPTAVLTLKDRRYGICREEHEVPLALDRAEQILGRLPPPRIICKTRHRLCYGDGPVWSIDYFEGPNAGLIIAEVELVDPEQRIKLPPWVGEEITLDPRYGNSTLARYPIGAWRNGPPRSNPSLRGVETIRATHSERHRGLESGSTHPMCGEFAFEVKFRCADELHEKAMDRGRQFFIALQSGHEPRSPGRFR